MAVLGGNPAAAVQYSGANQQGSFTIKPDAYYDKLLLKMLRQMEFKYSKYAVEKSLPKNYGDTINWRRFNRLEVAANKFQLNEGQTPEGLQISGSEVTAVIAQYGTVMYFTDIVDLQQLDKVRQEYTVELGYLAKETLDEIVRDVLVAEGSVYFAGGNTALSGLLDNTDDRPKIDDFRKIMLGMKREYITGNRKAGGKYVALISPEVVFALFDDQRVKDYMDFGQTNTMFADGMVLDMFGIRFEEVMNNPIAAGASAAVLVHDSIVIGEEAYAITKLEGAGIRVITKGLGSAGVEDPLDQRQSIGWKITGFGAKVLDPRAIVNYWSVPGEVAANFTNETNATAVGAYTVTFGVTDANITLAANQDGIATVLPGITLAEAYTAIVAEFVYAANKEFSHFTTVTADGRTAIIPGSAVIDKNLNVQIVSKAS